jgi:hypothetical protein
MFICRAATLYGRELEGIGETPQEAWEDMLGDNDTSILQDTRFFQEVRVIQEPVTVSVVRNVWKLKE